MAREAAERAREGKGKRAKKRERERERRRERERKRREVSYLTHLFSIVLFVLRSAGM